MEKIDRSKFLFLYEQAEFGTLTESAQAGLLSLLDFLEADSKVTDIRWAAYMLATALWETGQTYEPVAENGHGKGRPYGEPDPTTGFIYFGRGFVQLTWKDNYRTMGKALGVDLVERPGRAMEPDIAYAIMSYGMRSGAFTGVGLGRYLNGNGTDWVNARKIINGRDQAERIAGFAEKIHDALTQAQIVAA